MQHLLFFLLGQLVIGDHVVTIGELGQSLDGSLGSFIVTDLLSGFRVDCPAHYKSVESIAMALRTFAGSSKNRQVGRRSVWRYQPVVEDTGDNVTRKPTWCSSSQRRGRKS